MNTYSNIMDQGYYPRRRNAFAPRRGNRYDMDMGIDDGYDQYLHKKEVDATKAKIIQYTILLNVIWRIIAIIMAIGTGESIGMVWIVISLILAVIGGWIAGKIFGWAYGLYAGKS